MSEFIRSWHFLCDKFHQALPFFNFFFHTQPTSIARLLFTWVPILQWPGRLCILWCLVWLMLVNNIIPLTVSWLSWQWLSWQWMTWQWQWMKCAYLCLLEDHCINQNYMTTSHFFELWGVAVGTLGHDVRFACLVYFLYRRRYSDVARYLIQHMSPTWTDNDGMTPLHYACRWVVCPSYLLSRSLLWARGI